MKYHLCCNQCHHRWEVRDSNEKVIFYGTVDQADEYLEKLGSEEISNEKNN